MRHSYPVYRLTLSPLKEDHEVTPILRSILTDNPPSPGKVGHTTRVYIPYSSWTAGLKINYPASRGDIFTVWAGVQKYPLPTTIQICPETWTNKLKNGFFSVLDQFRALHESCVVFRSRSELSQFFYSLETRAIWWQTWKLILLANHVAKFVHAW